MRFLFRSVILAAVLAVPACGGGNGHGDSDSGGAVEEAVAVAAPDPDSPAPLGQEFILRYGQTIDVGPFFLKFNALAEDSRCPINATCLANWEGNARIHLVAFTGGHSEILELNTHSQLPNFAVYSGHVIELRSLEPRLPWYPVERFDVYEATLFVE
jgi:hypothetical protein